MGRMEVGAKMNFLLATLVGFVSGVIGAMGMGGGGVLIIYLTIFAGVKLTVLIASTRGTPPSKTMLRSICEMG